MYSYALDLVIGSSVLCVNITNKVETNNQCNLIWGGGVNVNIQAILVLNLMFILVSTSPQGLLMEVKAK